ncbi:MAG: hypothetical protein IJM56_03430 [Clostridia bacterium]|nr:hypothetical protein [Clostridia bacterium]
MILQDRLCHIFTRDEGDAVFLLGTGRGEEEYARRVFDLCREKSEKPFTLLSFACDDWDDAYSPWRAEVGEPLQVFPGGGSATLQWLTGACREYRQDHPVARFYPTGYSLAGLFALYALYESGLFSGAVACSSSLWFPGFMEYAAAKQLPQDSAVYLSLGGKEERSAPEYMRSVGDNTRALNRLLKQDAQVAATVLEMNPGGHFAPSEPRLAKGICWILENAARA